MAASGFAADALPHFRNIGFSLFSHGVAYAGARALLIIATVLCGNIGGMTKSDYIIVYTCVAVLFGSLAMDVAGLW